MDIQSEKIELIKLIADTESKKVLKKIKSILKSDKKMDETDRIVANPAMVKRSEESRQHYKEGKTVKISMDDIEKPYNPEFVAKMKRGEEDIKAGRTTKIEPADKWNLT